MATFLKNINLVSRSSTQFLDQTLGEAGIKGCQAKYILTVSKHPGISQDRLSKIMFVNKSNVARQLACLEEQGYIERRGDENDRRVSQVYATDKAFEELPRIRAANKQWREVITEGFTEEEKTQLLYLTEKLYANAVRYMEESK